MLITVQAGVYPAPCVLSVSCSSYLQGRGEGFTLERLSLQQATGEAAGGTANTAQQQAATTTG